MSEIRLKIEDAYLSAFWDYLRTLPNGSVQVVADKPKKRAVAKKQVRDNTAILKAATSIRKGVTLKQLAHEQGYTKTNWNRVNQLVKDVDIQEPIDELLAQLTP